MGAAATATRTAPRRKPAPARKASPVRKSAPARKGAPARRRAPARPTAGQLIPLAVGTATAVGRLPDSGLMVRMTRGRIWIGVLGVLLAGIVALNVVTLSLAATAGSVDKNIQALDQENSVLRSRDANKSAAGRVRRDAALLGLAVPTTDQVGVIEASPNDVATAAKRLAAAGTVY